PTAPGSGVWDAETDRSAPGGTTVTGSVAVSSLGSGSSTELETWKSLSKLPSTVGVTWTVMSTKSKGFNAPRSHVITPPLAVHVPTVVSTETRFMPAGSVWVSTVFGATPRPKLNTSAVYVRSPPTETGSGSWLGNTPRSAVVAGLTVVVSTSVL